MNKRSWKAYLSLVLGGMLSWLGVGSSSANAQTPSPASQNPSTQQPASNASVQGSQAPDVKAWGILREGLKDENAYQRAKAVRALGLLIGNTEAEKAALNALHDKKPNVRMAAAAALGSLQAQHANVELEGALQDSEPAVVLAAANSLLFAPR